MKRDALLTERPGFLPAVRSHAGIRRLAGIED